jgi:hypothetical protein
MIDSCDPAICSWQVHFFAGDGRCHSLSYFDIRVLFLELPVCEGTQI